MLCNLENHTNIPNIRYSNLPLLIMLRRCDVIHTPSPFWGPVLLMRFMCVALLLTMLRLRFDFMLPSDTMLTLCLNRQSCALGTRSSAKLLLLVQSSRYRASGFGALIFTFCQSLVYYMRNTRMQICWHFEMCHSNL